MSRLDADARFWQHVDRTSGCWLWTGHVAKVSGYGQLKRDGRVQYAHRYAFSASGRHIPAGLELDHVCRNRRCVRPSHLRVTTRGQNVQNHGGAQRNSATGIRGVTFRPDCTRRPYEVNVWLDRRRTTERYATLEEASAAAVALRIRLHTHNDPDRITP